MEKAKRRNISIKSMVRTTTDRIFLCWGGWQEGNTRNGVAALFVVLVAMGWVAVVRIVVVDRRPANQVVK